MGPFDSLETIRGVDVWRFALDLPPAEVEACWRVLSPDERARADRTRRGPRERYVVGRARLRVILAGHVGVAPASLALVTGPNGKPRLEAGPAFNLAHSGALGLIAVARDREVGVDVEELRVVPEAQEIARRWIGPDAEAALRSAGADRDRVFLRLWTRREALLKATGAGLADAERPPDPGEASRWEVVDLDPAPGYVGALAVERW